MKRTLQIHIDANRVTCGKCQKRGLTRHVSACKPSSYCETFYEWLPGYKRGTAANGLFRRCAPCLAAEREARK